MGACGPSSRRAHWLALRGPSLRFSLTGGIFDLAFAPAFLLRGCSDRTDRHSPSAAFRIIGQAEGTGLLMLPSPLVTSNLQLLADLCLRYRFPAITLFPEFAHTGVNLKTAAFLDVPLATSVLLLADEVIE